MKTIYKVLATGTTLVAALALGSCNNAEEIKKQTADQDAKIQSMVDAKLNDLQTQVNTECSAKVDSLAMVKFTAWQDEEAKAHKGGGKHKPKTEPKKTTNVTPAPAAPSNTNRGGASNNISNTNRGGGNTNTISNTNRGGGATTPH